MQFKIKEMKGKAACEWFYKQDSQGALRRQFCKRLWASIPRKDRGGRTGWLCLCVPRNVAPGRPHLSARETGLLGPNRRRWWSQPEAG